ncbi:hypothetical protein [Mesorhizobium salmacidum]|uniref:Uncharacterized protein n=1 Tax=Mesorhizobium salmacidum TaxID=3015171 RepID=A0ABU8KYR9_9HYPH
MKADERRTFWLHYWAFFGKSMAGWLVIVCIVPLVADTSLISAFSFASGFVVWAAMAAVWSIDPAENAVRLSRSN